MLNAARCINRVRFASVVAEIPLLVFQRLSSRNQRIALNYIGPCRPALISRFTSGQVDHPSPFQRSDAVKASLIPYTYTYMSHGGGLEPADAATTRAYDVQLASYSGTCGEKSVIPFLNASGLLKSHDVNADISVVYVHSVSSNAARNALLQHGSVITGPARHLTVYMPPLVINWAKCALTMPGCVGRSVGMIVLLAGAAGRLCRRRTVSIFRMFSLKHPPVLIQCHCLPSRSC